VYGSITWDGKNIVIAQSFEEQRWVPLQATDVAPLLTTASSNSLTYKSNDSFNIWIGRVTSQPVQTTTLTDSTIMLVKGYLVTTTAGAPVVRWEVLGYDKR
jgi:hypothetical protein